MVPTVPMRKGDTCPRAGENFHFLTVAGARVWLQFLPRGAGDRAGGWGGGAALAAVGRWCTDVYAGDGAGSGQSCEARRKGAAARLAVVRAEESLGPEADTLTGRREGGEERGRGGEGVPGVGRPLGRQRWQCRARPSQPHVPRHGRAAAGSDRSGAACPCLNLSFRLVPLPRLLCLFLASMQHSE